MTYELIAEPYDTSMAEDVIETVGVWKYYNFLMNGTDSDNIEANAIFIGFSVGVVVSCLVLFLTDRLLGIFNTT
ncbi:hypothetical protein GUI12_00510 [Anaplasmataceae bacterium AB001_6]|nr:hypothetical protein GUI12_00510 [Anaplasmataceae bacterium AB001_6]